MNPQTSVALDTSVMAYGSGAVVPKYAPVTPSASGDSAIVAAVAGKKIRVLAFYFMSNGAVNAKWRSGTTDISGLAYLDATGKGMVAPFNPVGWFETAVGAALNMNLSAAVALGGSVVYVEV